MKISESQKKVIKLMREGYELGNRTGFKSDTWVQKGGCGKGGESEDISFATFNSLYDKKLISLKDGQHQYDQPQRYKLTELGKTIQL